MRYLLLVALLFVSVPHGSFAQDSPDPSGEWCKPAESSDEDFAPPSETVERKVVERVLITPGKTPLPKGKGTLVRTVDRQGNMTVAIHDIRTRSGFTVDRQIYSGPRNGRRIASGITRTTITGITKSELASALRREHDLWQRALRDIRDEMRREIKRVDKRIGGLEKKVDQGFANAEGLRQNTVRTLRGEFTNGLDQLKNNQAETDIRQDAAIAQATGVPWWGILLMVAVGVAVLLGVVNFFKS